VAPAALARLPDDRLDAEAELALADLTPKARAYLLAVAAGTAHTAAATAAGLSAKSWALSRLKGRTERALRLLTEQTRRRSALTLEVAVEQFRGLYAEAREAKDYNAARGALREAALLAGLYPEVRLKLSVDRTDGPGVTPEEWEALARLRHEVRRLPEGQVVDALPVIRNPPVDAGNASAAGAAEPEPVSLPADSQPYPEGTHQ
jgi:hypothetical protein